MSRHAPSSTLDIDMTLAVVCKAHDSCRGQSGRSATVEEIGAVTERERLVLAVYAEGVVLLLPGAG